MGGHGRWRRPTLVVLVVGSGPRAVGAADGTPVLWRAANSLQLQVFVLLGLLLREKCCSSDCPLEQSCCRGLRHARPHGYCTSARSGKGHGKRRLLLVCYNLIREVITIMNYEF
jgi:hypothetical protein